MRPRLTQRSVTHSPQGAMQRLQKKRGRFWTLGGNQEFNCELFVVRWLRRSVW